MCDFAFVTTHYDTVTYEELNSAYIVVLDPGLRRDDDIIRAWLACATSSWIPTFGGMTTLDPPGGPTVSWDDDWIAVSFHSHLY
jgi:hypothetical protein